MEIQNKTQENFNLFARFIFSVFIIWLCFGCSSSRKVQKYETKIVETTKSETVTFDSSKTVVKTDSNIKIIDSSSTDEFVIIPIDRSQDMLVNGKKYRNAVLKHKKTKSNTVAEIKETIETATQKAVKTNEKKQSEKQTNIKTKDSVRKSGFPWWILILIAVAGIFYFGYRKFKGLPLV